MGSTLDAIWDDITYGNTEKEFIVWRDKYWNLCHQAGTLYQRKNSFSFTKKYSEEILRELFYEGWKPEDDNAAQ